MAKFNFCKDTLCSDRDTKYGMCDTACSPNKASCCLFCNDLLTCNDGTIYNIQFKYVKITPEIKLEHMLDKLNDKM